MLAARLDLRASSDYATPYTFTYRAAAGVSEPYSVAVDGAGNAYVANENGASISVISSTGAVLPAIGLDENPRCVAVDALGRVFITYIGFNNVQMATPSVSQGWTVTTIAGSLNGVGSTDGPGGTALFQGPGGIAVDAAGNVYVADTGNGTVRMITPSVSAGATTWTVSTIATGISEPEGLAVDSTGTLYVVETNDGIIESITPTASGGATAWVVAPIAGNGNGPADGAGSVAQFDVPVGIAVDGSGNLFVADTGNAEIRKIARTMTGGVATWAVTTIGGESYSIGQGVGTGSGALFETPVGVAVDSAGNVYVADANIDHLVWGAFSQPAFAGTPTAQGTYGQSFTYTSEFTGTLNDFAASGLPDGLTLDASTGVISGTIQANIGTYPVILSATNGAGTASSALSLTVGSPAGAAAEPGPVTAVGVTVGDGQATVSFNAPDYDGGAAITTYTVTATPPKGPSIVVTGGSSPIAVPGLSDGVTYSFAVTATNGAGTGASVEAPEPATPEPIVSYSATWLDTSPGYEPYGVAVDAAGDIYVTVGNAIEKCSLSGTASVFAGSIAQSGSADGSSSAALFAAPSGIAVDASGNLYVADTGNNAIRKVTAQGAVSTIAGLVQGDADGVGINAEFSAPRAVAVDGAGNVYVADTGNNLLRKIAPDGTTSTLVSGATLTFANAGQFASSYTIAGVAVDGEGNPCVGVQVSTPFGTGDFPSTEVAVLKVTGVNTFSTLYTAGAGSFYFSWVPGDGALAVDGHGDIHVLSGAAISDGSVSIPIPQGISSGPEYSFWAIAFDSQGHVFVTDSSAASVLVLTPVGTPPELLSQPSGAAIAYGAATTLSVAATGSPAPSYQWQLDGMDIAGATSSSYATSMPGSYTVVVTNSAGSVTSSPVVVSADTRLANISSRAYVGTGSDVEIAGFVVSGPPGTKEEVLIRGVGPALAQFSVAGPLAQPVLTLFDSNGNQVAANTGWNTADNAAQIAAAITTTGAFQYALDSADSALLVSLPPGAYTAQISGLNGTTGVALAEIYEITSGYPELINISTRAYVGTGSRVEIAGIVVSGSEPAKVLVRAVGPTLGQFGVSGALAQPSLSIMDANGNVLATNVGWSTSADAPAILSEAEATGAFALPQGSADSAILITLPPGNYTATVSGVGGTTGVALVEVYQAP